MNKERQNIHSECDWWGITNEYNLMDPPRGRNKRRGTNQRGWTYNQRRCGKPHLLVWCLFHFLNKYEEGGYHHQSSGRTQKRGHHQKKLQNSGTGGIKFYRMNLPVYRRWQINNRVKIWGMMVGCENIIKYEGLKVIKSTIVIHYWIYIDLWRNIAEKWQTLLMALIMWRSVQNSIQTLLEMHLIGQW